MQKKELGSLRCDTTGPLSHADIDTIIIGTGNLDHVAENVGAAQRGELSPDVPEERDFGKSEQN